MKRAFLAILSFTWLMAPATPVHAEDKEKVLYEAQWTSELGDGWSWVREEPKTWKVGKDGLSIRSLPGSLYGKEHTHKNLLLRKPPQTNQGLIVEVFLESEPMHQWEHAGLI